MHVLRTINLTILAALMLLGCEALNTDPIVLDGTWKFSRDSSAVGESEGWYSNDFDRSGWEDMSVPANWSYGNYDGFSWYSRSISYPNLGGGFKLALLFEGVDDNATVWLDGEQLGKHRGFNSPFYFDVAEQLADGEEHQLVVRIEDLGGPGGIHNSVFLKPYTNIADLLGSEFSRQTAPEQPEWAKNSAIYEIFVRAHNPKRTFKAVEADLDRIKALGAEIIWLMPIHPIGVERHKMDPGSPYAVRDYYAVNPRHGNLDDFKSLVDSVHARGMYIIIDMVLNHSAWDNPLIEEQPDWYTRNDAGEMVPPNEGWWDVADLDYSQSGIQQYMIEMLQWWLTETGIDGFRFDVAELVPNEFWAAAKDSCRAVREDVFWLAEGDKPFLYMNGHDMTYSWNIWESLIGVANGEKQVSELKQSYEFERFMFPRNSLRMRFTENHDKPRSRGEIQDDDLNLTAWAFAALMDGNPLIYAGQEIGMTERVDIHTDDLVDWENGDRDLETAMAEVLALRKEWLKWDSPFKIVLADDEKQVIAYKHGQLLSFFNFSENDFSFSAEGIDEVLLGDLNLDENGQYVLAAKKFGVVR